MAKLRALLFPLLSLILIGGCQTQNDQGGESLINTAHLDHLYETFAPTGDTLAFIWIYAEYPDYKPVGDEDEGVACVDDAARAAVFYVRHFQQSNQKSSLRKATRLLKFILYMQAENGLFYNFIDENRQIVKDNFNSKPEANWWTWRAMWAIAEGLKEVNFSPEFRAELKSAFARALPAVYEITDRYPAAVDTLGLKLPTWLPLKFAADQAAVLLYALVPFYQITKDEVVKEAILRLNEGIALMQIENLGGVFLSWQNLWHAYGNAQADALLASASVLDTDRFAQKALLEISRFYPQIIENPLNSFTIDANKKITRLERYGQIAYGVRPVVFASVSAHRYTQDPIYREQAVGAAVWLFGANSAGKSLYDPKTGRCYDGINAPDQINKNSGAESTIEALSILLELQRAGLSTQLRTKIRGM